LRTAGTPCRPTWSKDAGLQRNRAELAAQVEQQQDHVSPIDHPIAVKVHLRSRGRGIPQSQQVRENLEAVIETLKPYDPDILVLQEVVIEIAHIRIKQVEAIAQALGIYTWVFGECYNIGFALFLVVGATAILSKSALTPLINFDLAGRRPFYITRNNRRALWAEVQLGGQAVWVSLLLASGASATVPSSPVYDSQ